MPRSNKRRKVPSRVSILPTFVSASLDGCADGLIFTSSIRQTYRSDGARQMKAVFRFPYTASPVITRFTVEIGGKRFAPQALTNGKTAPQPEAKPEDGGVRVRFSAKNGFCTASIMNWLPGQTLVVEAAWAELMLPDEGFARLQLPTNLAPCFAADLLALEERQQAKRFAGALKELANPLAEAVMVLSGDLAQAQASVPGHEAAASLDGTDLRLQIERVQLGQALDVVVSGVPTASRCASGAGADGRRFALLQCMPATSGGSQAAAPLNLTLAMDCSGSLRASAGEAARSAALAVADELRIGDVVSGIGFACQSVVSLHPQLADASPGSLRLLKRRIRAMAGRGSGTDLAEGLSAAAALNDEAQKMFSEEKAGEAHRAILLVTDGRVRHPDLVVAAVEKRIPIFTIGVGPRPAEAVMRLLAEATGGAFELAGENEQMAAIAHRLLRRMRSERMPAGAADWGAEADWTLEPQSSWRSVPELRIAGFPSADALPLPGLPSAFAPVEARELAGADGEAAAKLAAMAHARALAAEGLENEAFEIAASAGLLVEASDRRAVLYDPAAESESDIPPAHMRLPAGASRRFLDPDECSTYTEEPWGPDPRPRFIAGLVVVEEEGALALRVMAGQGLKESLFVEADNSLIEALDNRIPPGTVILSRMFLESEPEGREPIEIVPDDFAPFAAVSLDAAQRLLAAGLIGLQEGALSSARFEKSFYKTWGIPAVNVWDIEDL